MADTIRELIIQSVISALGDVTVANGYNTNCGRTVRRVRRVENEELPGFCVIPQVETGEKVHGKAKISFPIRIDAQMDFTVEFDEDTNPSVAAEMMLGDLRKRIEAQGSADNASGGYADNISYVEGGSDEYPEPGHTRVGCYAIFLFVYKTVAGDPYSQ